MGKARAIRVIAIMVVTIMVVATCASYGASDGFNYKTSKTGKGYVTRFYKGNVYMGKVRTSKRLAVKVIKSGNLTAKRLETRKNNCIVVEVIKGKCVDSKGNGRTSDGHYISYKRVKGHKRGTKYTTYAVYGNNNSIDDITMRIDF